MGLARATRLTRDRAGLSTQLCPPQSLCTQRPDTDYLFWAHPFLPVSVRWLLGSGEMALKSADDLAGGVLCLLLWIGTSSCRDQVSVFVQERIWHARGWGGVGGG